MAEQPAATAPRAEWRPAVNPWLIAASVMLATFMEVLDTSIANVALNHIAGNLSASTDEATWVLTSYLVANAVVLPATGWLGRFFGRKRFLIACIVIFTLASLLCGLATSLPFLIVARIIQGAGGGALQPIAQSVLLESFPPEKRGNAMSVYAIGVVVAPILGPTLGGYLTDAYSWRWSFLINLPIGVVAVILCSLFLEDPPYLRDGSKPGRIDFVGLGLLTLWIGCLQIMLDKGQDEDWFSSTFICVLSLGAVIGFVVFLIWELRVANPIVNLRVLLDRNLVIGTLLLFLIGALLYATNAVLPLFLQNLLNYPSFQSGMVVSPRGIGAIAGSIIAGRVLATGKIDGRAWIAGGFVVLGVAMVMLGDLNTAISPWTLVPAVVISGFATTCVFVPMSTFSMATVSREQIGDASGIVNLARNVGGSVGISLVTALVTRGAQTHQALMVGHLSPFNPVFNDQLAAMQRALAGQSGSVTAQNQAYALMYRTLQAQASLFSYVDGFRLMVLVCFACAVLPFLFKRGARPPAGAAAAAH
ncbi:MAG TPA: DHA2 family efflux MFS transporter permease subunit [Chthoniobacterales bacterium]